MEDSEETFLGLEPYNRCKGETKSVKWRWQYPNRTLPNRASQYYTSPDIILENILLIVPTIRSTRTFHIGAKASTGFYAIN